MNKKNGRPNIYAINTIKEIIDEYVVYTQGTVILNASRIAEYARSKKGYVGFKYYHINRNEEAKEYLELLNKRIKENPAASNKAITNFEPIDIPKYLEKNKTQLQKSLIQLNKFMEQLADNNTQIVKEKDRYKNLLDKKALEIVELRKNIDSLKDENKKIKEEHEKHERQLKEKIRSLERDNVDRNEILKILWETEVESILIEEKILDKKEGKSSIDENKNITSLEDDFTTVRRDSKKVEKNYRNKLKGLF